MKNVALPRLWPLLFPLTYLLHIAEEYYCGERFYNWASRLSGIRMTEQAFLQLNAIFWCAMTLICFVAIWKTAASVMVIPLATAVLLNGTLHLVGTIFSASYSPGLVTGLTLWIPLGILTLRQTKPIVGRGKFWIGSCGRIRYARAGYALCHQQRLDSRVFFSGE